MNLEPRIGWQGDKAQLLANRSQSLANRLLGGEGAAQLVAYDFDPQITHNTLAHGAFKDGHLLVVDFAEELADFNEMRVRIDILKTAPEYELKIAVCSLHALGVLRWLDADEVADAYIRGRITGSLAETASMPGARVGVVDLEKVYLRDSSGIICISCDNLAKIQPAFSWEGNWDARELLNEIANGDLGMIFSHADAIDLMTQPACPCGCVAGRTFCVDIDRSCVTLMQVGASAAKTILVPFETEVFSLNSLKEQLSRLQDSALKRFSRI